jgi:hypothetical protein
VDPIKRLDDVNLESFTGSLMIIDFDERSVEYVNGYLEDHEYPFRVEMKDLMMIEKNGDKVIDHKLYTKSLRMGTHGFWIAKSYRKRRMIRERIQTIMEIDFRSDDEYEDLSAKCNMNFNSLGKIPPHWINIGSDIKDIDNDSISRLIRLDLSSSIVAGFHPLLANVLISSLSGEVQRSWLESSHHGVQEDEKGNLILFSYVIRKRARKIRVKLSVEYDMNSIEYEYHHRMKLFRMMNLTTTSLVRAVYEAPNTPSLSD